ncbi:hypothetical protein KUCAC02_014478, partial [Chaenocephalus aceratus]
GALQTRRLSFLQSGFEAITIALCIVLQEQRLWSRWFADGEDQEVHSTSDSPQNHRQNLAYIPLVNQIPPGRFRADLGSLWSPVPDCTMTGGMEGVALIELYITNGFSCYMHWRSILPRGLKLSKYSSQDREGGTQSVNGDSTRAAINKVFVLFIARTESHSRDLKERRAFYRLNDFLIPPEKPHAESD